jgi:hypothetical protein
MRLTKCCDGFVGQVPRGKSIEVLKCSGIAWLPAFFRLFSAVFFFLAANLVIYTYLLGYIGRPKSERPVCLRFLEVPWLFRPDF